MSLGTEEAMEGRGERKRELLIRDVSGEEKKGDLNF